MKVLLLCCAATFAGCEALRLVAPRGPGFRPMLARRVVLVAGRPFLVVAVVVTGCAGLGAAPAAVAGGAVAGWLLAAVCHFAAERRLRALEATTKTTG